MSVASSPVSRTPNSFNASSAFESVPSKSWPVDPTTNEVLREDKNDEDPFSAGDVTVDERLAIRGILVGVSLLRADRAEPDEGAD